MDNHILELSNDNKPKVLMLTTNSCGPCKMTKDMLKEYIDDGTLEVIDVTGKEEEYKSKYNFAAVPFFVAVDACGISSTGFMNKDMFDAKFDCCIHPPVIYDDDEDVVYGIEIGNTCPICKAGRVEDLGGCHSCVNCGAQLKCGI